MATIMKKYRVTKWRNYRWKKYIIERNTSDGWQPMHSPLFSPINRFHTRRGALRWLQRELVHPIVAEVEYPTKV